MKIKFILLIIGVSQIFASDLTEKEYYYPDDDDGSFMIKMLFDKLNNVLLENKNISKNLGENNKRLENITQLNEDVGSIKKMLNESITSKSWTVIQRRKDGSENFYRNWTDYKKGFGNPNGEFFIGLEKLHTLTTYGAPKELLIVLRDADYQKRYAKYDHFVIGSEIEKYTLKELGRYSGDAGDSFARHKGSKFSTKDQDNDGNTLNCAMNFKGAWWFHQGCYTCHLNGQYLIGATNRIGGINWHDWHGLSYSLKFAEMMIRDKI